MYFMHMLNYLEIMFKSSKFIYHYIISFKFIWYVFRWFSTVYIAIIMRIHSRCHHLFILDSRARSLAHLWDWKVLRIILVKLIFLARLSSLYAACWLTSRRIAHHARPRTDDISSRFPGSRGSSLRHLVLLRFFRPILPKFSTISNKPH